MQGVDITDFSGGVIIGVCIGWLICMLVDFLGTFDVKIVRKDRD